MEPGSHAAAVLVDCYARYRACNDPEARTAQARDLLEALLGLKDPGVLGPSGVLLVGQVYRELGMPEQTVLACRQAAASCSRAHRE